MDIFASVLCHRLPASTPQWHGIFAPLCYRCSGIYLGLLFGLVYQFAQKERKSGRLPSVGVLLTGGLFLVLLLTDSVAPSAFPSFLSANWRRLLTGLLAGSSLSAVILPLANHFTLSSPMVEPLVTGWRMLYLILACVAVSGTYFMPAVPVFFFLAFLGPAGVLAGFWAANLAVVGMILGRLRPGMTQTGFAAPALLATAAMAGEFAFLSLVTG